MTDVRYDRESTLAEYEQALSDCDRAIHAFERYGITAPPRYYREREGIKAALSALRLDGLPPREVSSWRDYDLLVSRLLRVA